MYKLLIVDDEYYVRDNIRGSINWELMNIEIIGEAEDGIEALSKIEQYLPEILLCDIKMPRMDGISLAAEVITKHPGTQIIFLSAYSDVAYLKNAIRIEAVDYLLKPIDLQDLVSSINRAKKRLDKYQTLHVQNNTDIALELITYASDSEKLNAYIDKTPLSVDFRKDYICIMLRLIAGISFSDGIIDYENDTLTMQTRLSHYYYAFTQNASGIWGNNYIMSKGGETCVIFVGIDKAAYNTVSYNQMLARFTTLVPDATLSIGISAIHHGAPDIKQAFAESRKASLSFFFENDELLHYFEEISNQEFAAPTSLKETFSNNLKKHAITDALSAIEEIISYMRCCSTDDIPRIRECLIGIALDIKTALKNTSHVLIGEVISEAKSLSDIYQYLRYLLEQLVSEQDDFGNKGRIVFDAENYIIEHVNENLTTRQIADHVYITPTYLCYLYKKTTGHTISQFILDLKMKRAYNMITHSNMRICDIAESLAYTNQSYFTKIFVSYYGITPSKLRSPQ